jgi:hypothetical protein
MTTVNTAAVKRSISPAVRQPSEVRFDAVAPPMLNSHEADARANSERVPCFWAHVLMLCFSQPLLGLGWIVTFASVPLALVSLVTSVFAVLHLSSLREVSIGCCCSPLNPYAWIFRMNILVLVFAVPTLGACIWITVQLDQHVYSGHPAFLALSVTTIVSALATIICAILALIKLSTLQRICMENSRSESNCRLFQATVLPGGELDASDNELDHRLLGDSDYVSLLPVPRSPDHQR